MYKLFALLLLLCVVGVNAYCDDFIIPVCCRPGRDGRDGITGATGPAGSSSTNVGQPSLYGSRTDQGFMLLETNLFVPLQSVPRDRSMIPGITPLVNGDGVYNTIDMIDGLYRISFDGQFRLPALSTTTAIVRVAVVVPEPGFLFSTRIFGSIVIMPTSVQSANDNLKTENIHIEGIYDFSFIPGAGGRIRFEVTTFVYDGPEISPESSIVEIGDVYINVIRLSDM